jgi:hypothetical protein
MTIAHKTTDFAEPACGILTIYEGRFGLQLDPARITHVEDVYDLASVRYARVHFKGGPRCEPAAPPCDLLDDDGDIFDALVMAGCRAA